MRSQPILGLSCLLLLCVVASAQHTYDGRDGPQVFGPPGNQVYIRGNNEGPYQVPGVPGTFENSASRGHGYDDGQGTAFTHTKNGGRQPSSHSIRGPTINAQHGPNVPQYPQPAGGAPLDDPYRRTRSVVISRPDRVVTAGGGGPIYISRNRRQTYHVERPGRTVDFSTGPGGVYVAQRNRRSPEVLDVRRPDGRAVRYSDEGFVANGYDGRSVALTRQRRQSVQGENFVARKDQAGVWNKHVSVWSRPDGRTVTVDSDGNVVTSGSPNGRGSQKYSG